MKTAIEDGRAIKTLWWDDDYGSQVEVGNQNVTKIEAYHEPGGLGNALWFAVYCGDSITQRVNGASVAGVAYQETTNE